MILLRRPCLAALLLIVLGSGRAPADLITFETTPNGSTPTDDAPIVGAFPIEGGGTVSFFFDTNGNNTPDPGVDVRPRYEQVGANGTDGFFSAYNSTPNSPVYDRARPGYGPQLGRFFARQPDGIGTLPGPFVIDYDTTQTIREFSGEIWDIDGNPRASEQWRVDVLNASGAVLASQTSPLGDIGQGPDSLDSLPWNFAFTNLPDGVKAVRLTFIGTKTDGVGLAFNNFSAIHAVPEPTSLTLLGLGALGLACSARRRRLPARARANSVVVPRPDPA